MKRIYTYIAIMMMMASCSHKNTEKVVNDGAGADNNGVVTQATLGGVAIGYRNSGPVNSIPKATAFRMTGDYADNVAITLNADGSLRYFPDPRDITDHSKPLNLGDGWYLNRQGISAGSVFTRYTFAEYSKLMNVPSTAELKAAIIPGAKVLEMRELPFSINEAEQHLDSIRSFLKTHPDKFKVTLQ